MKFSFRTKIYSGIIATALLAFAILCLYLWYTGNRVVEGFQHENAKDKLFLLERLLQNELQNQAVKQADWARWDDAYQFITDRNEPFIISNMNDESLKLIEVNMMAFVNNSGEVVYEKQVYDQALGEHSIPEKFLGSFTGESSLLDFDELSSVKKGVLVTPEHMLLVTAQPITTSDGRGARRGTLIFARYIDDWYMDTLSRLSGMKVDFSPYGFARTGVNVKHISLSRGVPVIHIEDGMVASSLLVDNIFGNPSLILGVTYPAAIVESGRGSIGQILGILFPGFLVYVSILLLCLEVFLVRRIENIRQVVRQVNTLHPGGMKEGDLDDLSYLSGVMMGAIEKVQESNDLADVTRNEIAKFRLALDQSFDHMIITDADGKILYANVAAEKMTGYSRVEMQGKTPALWGRQMPKEFYGEFWDTIRMKKKAFEGMVKNKRKNGEVYEARIRVAPVLDDKKRVLYFIGTERPLK